MYQPFTFLFQMLANGRKTAKEWQTPPYFSPIFWLTPGVLLHSPAFCSLVRSPHRLKKERNRLLRRLTNNYFKFLKSEQWLRVLTFSSTSKQGLNLTIRLGARWQLMGKIWLPDGKFWLPSYLTNNSDINIIWFVTCLFIRQPVLKN